MMMVHLYVGERSRVRCRTQRKSDVLHSYIGNNLPGLLSIQEMFSVQVKLVFDSFQ